MAKKKPPSASDHERLSDMKSLLRSLADQLDAVSDQRSGPLKYNCYSIVVQYGREFTPASKPKDIQWGEDNDCYGNAFKLMNDGLIYCEGYAVPNIGNMVHETDHAWCVDANGNVIDNTWRKPEIGRAHV